MSDSRWITRSSAADHQAICTEGVPLGAEICTSCQSAPSRRYVAQVCQWSDSRWQTSGTTKPIALISAPRAASGGATYVLRSSRLWPNQRATTAEILVAS